LTREKVNIDTSGGRKKKNADHDDPAGVLIVLRKPAGPVERGKGENEGTKGGPARENPKKQFTVFVVEGVERGKKKWPWVAPKIFQKKNDQANIRFITGGREPKLNHGWVTVPRNLGGKKRGPNHRR